MSKTPKLSSLKRSASKQVDDAPEGETLVKEAARTIVPKWQQGKRAVTVWVNEEQYKRINDAAFDARKPVRRLVFEALNMVLPEYNRLPVPESEND